VTAPGRVTPFAAGAQVALRHVRNARTWCVLPVTVLDDSRRRAVLRIHAGSTWLAAVDVRGARAHGWQRRWRLAKLTWYEHDVTYVIDAGAHCGIGLFTAPGDDAVVQWYVNAQDPLRRCQWGFDTMDRELDVVLRPPTYRPQWKDQIGLARLIRTGMVSPATASRLTRVARTSAHRLQSSQARADLLPWARRRAPIPDLDHVLARHPAPGVRR
jgi:hypothetical protein